MRFKNYLDEQDDVAKKKKELEMMQKKFRKQQRGERFEDVKQSLKKAGSKIGGRLSKEIGDITTASNRCW